MQANSSRRGNPRAMRSSGGARAAIVGSNGPRVVPPAWRDATRNANPPEFLRLASDTGSRALVSHLPPDVTELEIAELFQETVGPLKDAFLVYNNAGRSKGMAVVSFERPQDASRARQMYNHKIIDQRRPIRIELIIDNDRPSFPPPSAAAVLVAAPIPQVLSLKDRIGPLASTPAAPKQFNFSPNFNSRPTPHVKSHVHIPVQARANNAPARGPRQRLKKGPKRTSKSKMQLDNEMEEYRAGAPAFDFKNGATA